MTPLPTLITLILPVLVTMIAGLFTHNKLPSWLEALVVFVVVAGSSIGAVVLNQGLTPNLIGDFVLISAYSVALMNSPILQPLYQWLQVNTPSPLAGIVKIPQPAIVAAQDVTTPVIARSPLLQPPGQGYMTTTKSTDPPSIPPPSDRQGP